MFCPGQGEAGGCERQNSRGEGGSHPLNADVSGSKSCRVGDVLYILRKGMFAK